MFRSVARGGSRGCASAWRGPSQSAGDRGPRLALRSETGCGALRRPNLQIAVRYATGFGRSGIAVAGWIGVLRRHRVPALFGGGAEERVGKEKCSFKGIRRDRQVEDWSMCLAAREFQVRTIVGACSVGPCV